jgi:hypothetical protein
VFLDQPLAVEHTFERNMVTDSLFPWWPWTGRAVVTKYRSERKGRRNFDAAQHHNTVEMIVTEESELSKKSETLGLQCSYVSP